MWSYIDFIFADVILNLLFGQYTNVVTSRNKTMSNQSFRKLHEKVVSDVVSILTSKWDFAFMVLFLLLPPRANAWQQVKDKGLWR